MQLKISEWRITSVTSSWGTSTRRDDASESIAIKLSNEIVEEIIKKAANNSVNETTGLGRVPNVSHWSTNDIYERNNNIIEIMNRSDIETEWVASGEQVADESTLALTCFSRCSPRNNFMTSMK